VSRICALLGLHTPGAFAEYIAVPEGICYAISDELSFEAATFAEPLGNAVRAVAQTPLAMSDSLLVVGVGIIGLLALQAAKLRTGGKIIATDVVDAKLDLAKKFGADLVLNPAKQDVVKAVREITGGTGVEHSIEVVGHQNTLRQAISSTAPGGTVTVVGLMDQFMEIDAIEVVTKEIKLQGHYGYSEQEFATALQLMTRRKVDVQPLISKTFPLEAIADSFEAMAIGKTMKSIITP